MESSCYDFFQMQSSLWEIGAEYAQEEIDYGNPTPDDINEKEAIRWFLMGNLSESNYLYGYFGLEYLLEKLRHFSVRENDKLLTLFELYRTIKKNR
jgi:hypothetical protein